MRANWAKVFPSQLASKLAALEPDIAGFYTLLLLDTFVRGKPYNLERDAALLRRRFCVRTKRLGEIVAKLERHHMLGVEGGDLRPADYAETLWGRVSVPRHVREFVLSRDGASCKICGAEDDLTIDHIVPVALGGADNSANYQVLCRPCNSAKGAIL